MSWTAGLCRCTQRIPNARLSSIFFVMNNDKSKDIVAEMLSLSEGPATDVGGPSGNLGTGAATGDGTTPSGQRIWQGSVHISGHRNRLVVPCVAVRYETPDRPPVHDSVGWPQEMKCDASKLKQVASVFQYINAPESQWYVRFAPVDAETGIESSHAKLVQLLKVMVQRHLAFEIECDNIGSLYLWGMDMPPYGYSLLGVFRPKNEVAQDASLNGSGIKSENMPLDVQDNPQFVAPTQNFVMNNANTTQYNVGSSTTASNPYSGIFGENTGTNSGGPSEGTLPTSISMGGNIPSGAVGGGTDGNGASGQHIWRGNLHIIGRRNDLVVPSVAMRNTTPERPPLQDTTGWPTEIYCDSSKLKQCASVFPIITEPNSEWYAQFAPVDTDGNEITDPKLVQFVRVMIQRQLTFEIECEQGENVANHGTLYLWGMYMPTFGYSLVGVFKPKINYNKLAKTEPQLKSEPKVEDVLA